jgi:DNA-binding transcriptional LysR family regulator
MKNMERRRKIKIDFDLLNIFLTLYDHKDITLTAAALDLKLPVLASAIQKLRTLFSDRLFIRVNNTFTTTLKADDIFLSLNAGMGLINSVVNKSTMEKSANRSVVIGATPYVTHIALPLILQFKEQHAFLSEVCVDHIDLPHTCSEMIDLLNSGDVDFIISYTMLRHENVIAKKLFTDKVDIISSVYKNFPGNMITKDDYLSATHAVLSPITPAINSIKKDIETAFPHRIIGFSSDYYLDLLAVVEVSEMISLIPQMLYNKMHNSFDIRSLRYKFNLGFIPPTLYLFYNKNLHQDDSVKWILDAFYKVTEE